MRWSLRRFTLTKQVPLTISRGTTAAVEHLLLELEHGGQIGRGETGGFDTGQRAFSTAQLEQELTGWLPQLEAAGWQEPAHWPALLAPLSAPARCAVDLALHDLWGQLLAQPLWRLWGLDLRGCQPTSVTLGLAPVEKVLERLSRWRQQLPASRVKLKLGSPDGLSHDQALVEALLPVLGGAELQVDANGGWSLEGARQMLGNK